MDSVFLTLGSEVQDFRNIPEMTNVKMDELVNTVSIHYPNRFSCDGMQQCYSLSQLSESERQR